MVQKGSGTAPTESQSGDGNNAVTDYKKYTAHGLVRRGCPKGQPAREIQPQPIQVSWQAFTSHGLLDSDAAFRRDRFKLTTTLREALSA